MPPRISCWLWFGGALIGSWACTSASESDAPGSAGSDENAAGTENTEASGGSGGRNSSGASGVGTGGSVGPPPFGGSHAGQGAASGDAGASGASAGGEGGATSMSTDVNGKMLMGYQGWFSTPADGSETNRWHHWFREDGTFLVDMWPDLSELDPDELFFRDGVTFPGGAPAPVFSSHSPKTVARHFSWMQEYGIDGVLLQRFLGEVQDPVFRDFRDQVTRNVIAGAEGHGRVFAIEYDFSMGDDPEALGKFVSDYQHLVDDLGIFDSPSYLTHEGRPLVFIWGFGFTDRPTTPALAQEIIDWIHETAPERYRAAICGGVPTYWRTLTEDSKPEPEWASVYRSFDIVSPWSVGRYRNDAGIDGFRADQLQPDLAELTPLGIEYLPVVFPGFSWFNLNGGASNEIPRMGGRFYWRQVYNALEAGATLLKTAMFDEVDEGTAMFKLARTSAEVPGQSTFVPLDADGEALPSDHYLWLAGRATAMLRGEIARTPEIPQR